MSIIDSYVHVGHYLTVECNTSHEDSLMQLAELSFRLQSSEAESYATEAVRNFPYNARGWYSLSQILSAANDHNAAATSLETFLSIEETTPILPFSWIKRTL